MPTQPASVLFVDDDPAVLAGLKTVLRSERHRWTMRFAARGDEALQALAAAPADVVVTDMRMPGMDGLTLLRRVRELYPATARIVLSGYADLGAVAQASAVAHQYLLKPCEAGVLRGVVGRAIELRILLDRPGLREVVGSLGALPTVPGVYHALTAALGDADAGVAGIAAIVNRDVGLAGRVLQFVNSAYFGLARQVTSIESAIVYLGLNTLRHLALTLEVLRAFEDAGAEVERFQRHSILVARIARRLTGDPVAAEAAFAAGLMHDAGKLAIMARLPDTWRDIQARARAAGTGSLQAEREVLGADHAEVGAYLLGLWSLPHVLVEAVAFHHAVPSTPLTLGGPGLVAVADALAHQVTGDLDGLALDPAWVGSGLDPGWSALARQEAGLAAGAGADP
jgi:HD-like signal output (HDOD) protein/ActR/RegA family two-component response regulator